MRERLRARLTCLVHGHDYRSRLNFHTAPLGWITCSRPGCGHVLRGGH